MKKSKPKKSTKARKHRHQTQSRKKRHAVAKKPALQVAEPAQKPRETTVDNPTPKPIAPANKPVVSPATISTAAATNPIPPNSTSPQVQKPPETAVVNPTPKPYELANKPVVPPATISTAAATNHIPPKTPSPQSKHLDQGEKLKQLHKEGTSLAGLAKKLGCSKRHVRDLVELADLPEDLKRGYLEGKLGRKKVLTEARARVKAAQKTEAMVTTKEVPTTPQPSASGMPQPNAPGTPKPSAPVKPQPSTPPVMTVEHYRRKVEENVELAMDWFHSRDLPPGFWEPFFSQVDLALYGPFPWLFTEEAPRPGENWAGKDPQEVIKLCRPEGKEDSMADIVNNLVKWLARWIQRVIPDQKMMLDVLALAEAALLREAWERIVRKDYYKAG